MSDNENIGSSVDGVPEDQTNNARGDHSEDPNHSTDLQEKSDDISLSQNISEAEAVCIKNDELSEGIHDKTDTSQVSDNTKEGDGVSVEVLTRGGKSDDVNVESIETLPNDLTDDAEGENVQKKIEKDEPETATGNTVDQYKCDTESLSEETDTLSLVDSAVSVEITSNTCDDSVESEGKVEKEVPSKTSNTKQSEEVPSETSNTKQSEEVPSETSNAKQSEEVPSETSNANQNAEVPSETSNTKESEEVPIITSSTKPSQDVTSNTTETDEKKEIIIEKANDDKAAKKNESSKKSSSDDSLSKKSEKKDNKSVSKKPDEYSYTRESPSRSQPSKPDSLRSKTDSRSSTGGRGDGRGYKKEEEKYDQRKKISDDRGKRSEEKDSKRYSDRRERERNYRDDKAKRFEDERRKDDRNGKRGSGDSKTKSSDGKSTKENSSKPLKDSESGKKSAPLPDLKSKHVKSASDLEAQWQKEEDQKRQKEEEEKKKEEEKRKEEEELKQKEEEKKRKEEEDARKLLEDEKKSLSDFIKENKEKQDVKDKLREKNASIGENRPDEAFFRKLDSNLKKNTAFVKKLRNLTESQKDSLVKDFEALNLSKYVGEVAAAITEAKLKMSDIPCAVLICSLMYQRYADFPIALMENWQKYLLHKKDEKISNPSKYRVDLRFFAELVSVGVIKHREGLGLLANQLGLLMNNDKEGHNNLSIVTSFCKHCGEDYAGLIPRKFRLLSEKYGGNIPKRSMLTPERQKACRNLFGDYYQSLCKHLIKDHKELKSVERQNRKILHTKGEISQDRKEHYDALLTGYQKLFTNTSVFADLLDEDLPDLPEEDMKRDDESGFDIFHPEKDAEFQYVGDTTLFEDEDSRVFYENLPDLKAFIPGICFKDSEQGTTKEPGEEENIDEFDLKIEDVEREMETEQQIAEVESKEEQEGKEEESTDVDLLLQEGEEEDTDTGSLMKMQFDAYVQSLPNCVNRELIDKAAIEFCMNFNTKMNRKKLVKALFTVHRTRYDLLSFYARMVATLFPCMPDVANDLVQLLKGDFRWHVRKKDQINIESKLKTVRFIGELVKFNLFPKSEALHCIKMLMFDFFHHNIEMACALLDNCGRFLYRSQDSHHRTKIYLDVMMRKKSALHLENRYTTMIENAFYYSNPPEVQQMARKVRPPMHEYIRKLLYKDLSKTTTEKVLRQLRKLKWDDPEIAFYATKCLIAVWNLRYNSIHCSSNLLAGLAPYYEHVAIQVVDGVLEDIRLGMEVNHPKFNQRRVSCAKYLGELYNYRLVESSVIFKTLYSFITFGVSYDENTPSPLDPPEHLFRVRLTCVILETCGQYFDKGSSKKKLDCFLLYFQKYYLYKKMNPIYNDDRPFPIDVKNLFQDTMETIRPKTKLLKDHDEALKAIEDLEKEVKPKLASVLTLLDTDMTDEGNNSEPDDGLCTIQESEENDELSQSLSQLEMDDSGTSQEDGLRQYSQDIEAQYADESNEDYMSESAGEDFDPEVNVITGASKNIKCQEDDDFLSAFDKMMADNIQARSQESLKVPQMDIAVPTQAKNKNKYNYDEPKEEKASIEFMLMTRRGNKQQFTNINVPISAEFATKFKERTQAEKAEKEKMKQVVLGIHERQEEEDYQEMIASMNRQLPTVNANRERRVRYQHPKGAPDADLIFGSKKR
ncbi:regulator of nonsense transcripts 2-like isoform X3 [Mytilus galloprovincialis]|uniref:regulator of nonsense transcripts 2-like isoform X3 n=1 Tax=Mytilus galloprovincialis TaxID=29158 RepID=UPI003F7BA857